jgi:hypothetical protein
MARSWPSLGNPDMRTPIAHAMAWPERIDSGVAPLDLVLPSGSSTSKAPDLQRFPCLDLAYRALRAEGNAAAVLNAANEVAVAAFLDGRLPFLGIADLIAATLDTVPQAAVPDLAAVLEADRQATPCGPGNPCRDGCRRDMSPESLAWYVGAFVVALAVLVVVHEMGHYLAARACGVKVLRFAFGFGRVIWMRTHGRDRTEWAVSVFPLGGYVKMLDEREGEVAA